MIKKLIIISLFTVAAGFSQQENNLLLRYTLGQSYENSGDLQNAIKIYEELYQSDPNNPQYFSSLNKVYVAAKNYAASVNLLEDRIAKFPQDINSYGLLGSTYYQMGNEQKAFKVWDEALEKPDVNIISFRVIANYAIERRAFEKAIEVYEKGKSRSDDKQIYSFDLGRLYGITMQFGKMANEYCEILKNESSQYQVVKANVFSFLNKPEALQKIIPVFEDAEDGSNFSVTRLLAELYTQAKDYDEAFELYVKLDKNQSSNGMELLDFAQLLLREKEYITAANTFKEIYSLYPDAKVTSVAKLGYAKSIEAKLFDNYTKSLPLWKPEFKAQRYDSDEVTKVLDAFEEIVSLYKNSESAYEALLRIGMINLYMLGSKETAINYFKKIVSEAPLSNSSGESYLELGNIEFSEGNFEEAENYYAKVGKARSEDQTKNEAIYKLARINYFKGNNSEAAKLANSLTENLKNDFANDAIEFSIILNNAKFDSSNNVLFAEAEMFSDQKKFKEAAELFKQISEDKSAILFGPIAKYKLAEMEIAMDNFTGTIDILGQIVEEKEKNMYSDKALFLMAKTYQFGLNDNAKAIETYEKLLAEFPNSILINEARENILSLRNKLS